MTRTLAAMLALALVGAGVGCSSKSDGTSPVPTTDAAADNATDSASPEVADSVVSPDAADSNDSASGMVVTSSAFVEGAPIPATYTCSGAGSSPPLAWSGAPAAARSFALIVDDPDAPGGTFTHWVLFDLPGSSGSLAAGSSGGGVEGKNSFGANAYGGPCPPAGKAHRYFFKLFALDVATVSLPVGSARSALETAMTGHVVAQGSLMGTFAR
jgi:Raf kinase inhibitor-like YbhB/YbcL family protein